MRSRPRSRTLRKSVLFEQGLREGRIARRAGQPEESCPYKPGNYAMKYMGWFVGWHERPDTRTGPPVTTEPNDDLTEYAEG